MIHKKLSEYFKEKYGVRIAKISVDAGFSCPNRDGKISAGGCIYCDNKAFNFEARQENTSSLENQIFQNIEFAKNRFKAKKFFIYFQAYTNTYAPAGELKQKYDVIKKFDDIVGLSIATRPDVVSDEILDLIESYAKDYEVWIEYGLQSMHNKTLEFINRGHTYEDFLNAVKSTKKRNIKACVHLILGLPNETLEDMIQTVKAVSCLKIDGIKFHPLHVVKGTKLEELYNQGKVRILELDEYKKVLSECLKVLDKNIIIHRLSAYCPKDVLVAPMWVGEKDNIIID